jgi:hypothetical protein
MNLCVRRWLAGAFGLALLTLLSGCVVGGAGYEGGGADISYGADFYEPYGYEYGGWGSRYHVGPPRGGERRPEHSSGSRPPAYRPAAPSRSMPSIPSRPRGH